MEIISQEERIEFKCREIKDILVPCYMFSVPSNVKDSNLNFLEKTVFELVCADESLKNDKARVAKMLGFEGHEDVILSILEKVAGLNLDENGDNQDGKYKNFLFFKEAYTGRVLETVVSEFNEFAHGVESKNVAEFTLDNKTKRAKICHDYDRNNSDITPSQIYKAISLHNKNKFSKTSFVKKRIDLRNFEADETKGELVFLHVRVVFLESGGFLVTNGWGAGFSEILKDVFESKPNLRVFINSLQKEKDVLKDEVEVPFDDGLKAFSRVFTFVQKSVGCVQKLKPDTDDANLKKQKAEFLGALHDTLEALFEVEGVLPKTKFENFKNQKFVQKRASELGFKLGKKPDELLVLKASERDDLRKFLCKFISFWHESMSELVFRVPKFVLLCDCLFKRRPEAKHATKKEQNVPKEFSRDELFALKEMVFEAVSVVLKVKRKTAQSGEFDKDAFFNESKFLVDEFNEVLGKIPSDVKEELKTTLRLRSEFCVAVANDFVLGLCKVFEGLLLRLNEPFLVEKFENSKTLIKEVCDKFSLQNSVVFSSVKPEMVSKTLGGKSASLQASFLVFLHFYADCADEAERVKWRNLAACVEKVVQLRGHGNKDASEFVNFGKDACEKLWDECKAWFLELIQIL